MIEILFTYLIISVCMSAALVTQYAYIMKYLEDRELPFWRLLGVFFLLIVLWPKVTIEILLDVFHRD